MGMAFGFGGRMLLGSLACFVHGLFPWLCLTRGSDTIRGLHHRMVTPSASCGPPTTAEHRSPPNRRLQPACHIPRSIEQ